MRDILKCGYCSNLIDGFIGQLEKIEVSSMLSVQGGDKTGQTGYKNERGELHRGKDGQIKMWRSSMWVDLKNINLLHVE